MTRHKGIIAYGTQEDREKLAVLSQLTGKSGSEILIDLLRQQYQEVTGGVDPKSIIPHRS